MVFQLYRNLREKIRRFVRKNIVADVQPEIARCMFECEKTQCHQSNFEKCEKRIEYAENLKNQTIPVAPTSVDSASTVSSSVETAVPSKA